MASYKLILCNPKGCHEVTGDWKTKRGGVTFQSPPLYSLWSDTADRFRHALFAYDLELDGALDVLVALH